MVHSKTAANRGLPVPELILFSTLVNDLG